MDLPALAHVLGLAEINHPFDAHVILADPLSTGLVDVASLDIGCQDRLGIIGLDHEHAYGWEFVPDIGGVGDEQNVVVGVVPYQETDRSRRVVDRIKSPNTPKFTDTHPGVRSDRNSPMVRADSGLVECFLCCEHIDTSLHKIAYSSRMIAVGVAA